MNTRLALLLPPLLVLAGCADNNASLRVAAMCAPPTDAAACAFAATCDAQWIGENVLDVGTATAGFVAIVQVDNLLPDNANANTFRTNTNDAYVQEFEVDYGGVLPKSTGTVYGSAHVPAGGSAVIAVPGVSQAVRTTLNAAMAAGAQLDVVAKLRLKGVLADTSAFETGDFQFPIRICKGCPTTAAPTCTAPAIPAYCPGPGQLPGASGCTG